MLPVFGALLVLGALVVDPAGIRPAGAQGLGAEEARDRLSGVIRTTSQAPVGMRIRIGVQAEENTGINARLEKAIARQLEALGYEVDQRAETLLMFRASVSRSSDPGGPLIRNPLGGSDLRVNVPRLRTGERTQDSQYHLSMTIERPREPVLWWGAAVLTGRSTNWDAVMEAMARRLLQRIDQTVAEEPLSIE